MDGIAEATVIKEVETNRFKLKVEDCRFQKDSIQDFFFAEKLKRDRVDLVLNETKKFLGNYSSIDPQKLMIKIIDGCAGEGAIKGSIIEIQLPSEEKAAVQLRHTIDDLFPNLLEDQRTNKINELALALSASTFLHEGTQGLLSGKYRSKFVQDFKKAYGSRDKKSIASALLVDGIAYAMQGIYTQDIGFFDKLAPCIRFCDKGGKIKTREALGVKLMPKIKEYIMVNRQLDVDFLIFASKQLKNLYLEETQEAVGKNSESVPTNQEKFANIVNALNRYYIRVKDGDLTPEEFQTLKSSVIKNFDVLETLLISGDKFRGALTMLKEVEVCKLVPELKQLAQTTSDNYVRNYAVQIRANSNILYNQPLDCVAVYDTERTAFAIHELFKSRNIEDNLLAQDILNREFSKWGVSPDKFLKTWNDCVYGVNGYSGMVENLPRAIEIESLRPGIIRTLSQEFGIVHFGRYPKDLLVNQFDEKDDQIKPYGVIVFPKSDWNGAFFQDSHIFRKLGSQLKDKFNIRIIEVENKFDVVRGLVNFKRRYPAHKISFAIIGGHGTKYTINFGKEKIDGRHRLEPIDLVGERARGVSEFFEPNPSIVLISCSTGAEGGIGQQLSRLMGARVVAPEIPTGISSINSMFDSEGKISFNVEYAIEDAKRSFLAGQKEDRS